MLKTFHMSRFNLGFLLEMKKKDPVFLDNHELFLFKHLIKKI